MEASISTVPTKRSSVTPRGTCTKGASRMRVITSPFASRVTLSSNPSSHVFGCSGSLLQIDPSTTSIGGSSACRPRAMIDLAVPRLPEMAMPPSAGSMAPSNNADLMFSCPTTNARGKVCRIPLDSIGRSPSRSIAAASAARAAMTSGSIPTAAFVVTPLVGRAAAGRLANPETPLPATGDRRAA